MRCVIGERKMRDKVQAFVIDAIVDTGQGCEKLIERDCRSLRKKLRQQRPVLGSNSALMHKIPLCGIRDVGGKHGTEDKVITCVTDADDSVISKGVCNKIIRISALFQQGR